MEIKKEDVENVALLSRLNIKEDKMDENINYLKDFLSYVDILKKLDTDNVKPTAHVLPVHNVFRDDIVKPSLDREMALQNAPHKENGYFCVPKILED